MLLAIATAKGRCIASEHFGCSLQPEIATFDRDRHLADSGSLMRIVGAVETVELMTSCIE
ncbi:MAG: hypothetical protein RLZZ135_2547 [Cyanobacteriota bacterium]